MCGTQIDLMKAWVAGFIDGEGCLRIGRRNNGSGSIILRPTLSVSQRDDNEKVFRTMDKVLGSGYRAYKRSRGHSNPVVCSTWHSRDHIKKIIETLDFFPLRGKKQDEYLVWRSAALIYLKGIGSIKKHDLILRQLKKYRGEVQ